MTLMEIIALAWLYAKFYMIYLAFVALLAIAVFAIGVGAVYVYSVIKNWMEYRRLLKAEILTKGFVAVARIRGENKPLIISSESYEDLKTLVNQKQREYPNIKINFYIRKDLKAVVDRKSQEKAGEAVVET